MNEAGSALEQGQPSLQGPPAEPMSPVAAGSVRHKHLSGCRRHSSVLAKFVCLAPALHKHGYCHSQEKLALDAI